MDQTQHLLDYVAWKIIHSFVALGSSFSAASLLSALLIAVAFILLKRPRRNRDVKARVMFRALFPAWLYRSASFRADLVFLVFNVFLFGILFGWAVLSSELINQTTSGFLAGRLGNIPSTTLNDFTRQSITTIVLFLAYEIGYWTYHYLSHRIPLLWEFHKVHHTAEVLSPITNFRVHPVDTILFQNCLALVLGTTGGTLGYIFGTPISFFEVSGTNIILIAFLFVTVHLQHSHIWIAATGPLGRALMSPAHHQLHHSDNPLHFNKNFGSCLSVWDWLFGTLQMPTRKRERLIFGVGTRAGVQHSAVEVLITPFRNAFIRLAGQPRKLQRN